MSFCRIILNFATQNVFYLLNEDTMSNIMTETSATKVSDYSLGKILSDLLSLISKEQQPKKKSNFLQALYYIYNSNTCSVEMPPSVCKFMLNDDATGDAIKHLKAYLQSLSQNDITALNSPITYLLDELICNIQQHAQVDAGYAFVDYDSVADSIEIVVADEGITIYGSYLAAQKGEFAVFSGNALLVQFADRKEVLSLPKEIDFKGTMVIVRFPAHAPADFDFYKYIS